jgi:NAD(P)-dependent dehydrogenase (short-subunit alcohol dehydrogenase family)
MGIFISADTPQVAVVTGGNSGLGLAIATSFLDSGAKVASLDLADEATSPRENLLYLKCDIAKEAPVKAAISKIVDALGHIDILVNNAGIFDYLQSVTDITAESWHRVIDVNVTGPFNMMHACIPLMLNNSREPASDAPPTTGSFGGQQGPRVPAKGVVINICSTASVHGAAAGAAYTTSKHALLGLTRNSAFMYRDQGLRVNAVLPGGTDTSMLKNLAGKIKEQNMKTLMPFLSCQPPTL